ncbi:MAG: hypothetical protein GEU98_20450 [Pseudonocardiaceae bacterium]|nr:hypothetical protein [Pseudonocardiaceae bacterium]
MDATTREDRRQLRSVVAESWRRSELSGLHPDAATDRLEMHDVDRGGRLVRAATPALDEMARHLDDTNFCVMLADRDGHIVDRRFAERSVERALDGVSAVPGCRFVEESSGTNSIATPLEIRRGITVSGAEHYLEGLKKFTCYGHPIFHPATERLEGVLDITGLSGEESALLAPFVVHAVADIEQRLIAGSKRAEQRLLAAFQSARHRAAAVLALGDDMVLANTAAVDLVDAADHALLREAAQTSRHSGRERLRLTSGTTVEMDLEAVAGNAGTLFSLTPVRGPRDRIPRRRGASRILPAQVERDLLRCGADRERVLIAGEPGTGRTAATRLLARCEPLIVLGGADLPTVGEVGWSARLDELAGGHPGLLVIEDVHLLPPVLAARLCRVLDASDAWIAITSAPVAELRGEHAGLLARVPRRVELPPLRTRRAELPALARTMLAGMAPGRSLRLTASALELLTAQSWPGNFRELEAVLHKSIERRSVGDIIARDLPDAYQVSAAHPRTPWEQAEHDAITRALRAAEGNKVHAARDLGISRSTLYNRIKSLGINA